ncbi:TetR family transcriptional regulator [Corynebacterium renale]|uniref:TetR family transcriptional regulator n=1 Tax=Corynebacterium renale TaxID=1724 RepID=UPI000DBE96E5|nr:TetR family transcriptional regulator [Corynebacterium renale]
MQLTRHSIVDAAFTILRRYGLGDVTMRRVASELGVAPGALYWHVANKQELLRALSSHIIQPALTTDYMSPADRATAFRRCVLSVRDGADVVSVGLADPIALRGIIEVWTSSFTEAGQCAPERGALGAETLLHYCVGAVLNQQTLEQLGQESLADQDASFTAGVELIVNATLLHRTS